MLANFSICISSIHEFLPINWRSDKFSMDALIFALERVNFVHFFLFQLINFTTWTINFAQENWNRTIHFMGSNSYNLQAIHISIDLFLHFYRRQFLFSPLVPQLFQRGIKFCAFLHVCFLLLGNLWTTNEWKKAKTHQRYICLAEKNIAIKMYLSFAVNV